ncbi:class II fumarate hydratase [Thiohalomonas denitrificans]|uniref:Fumarate hydratase class II n=1 Tax=Thiohalomonas denitrificans TaxID=415747 RepID=A0A1G5Q6K0_9GAMM|nr:class II fumarate hydratase [Thiohalomonas denitrificans]SCZ57090.1 fumarase, class II [Thiohalomonas denitrificans]
MSEQNYRTERDSMGELQVPADALYGAQTQRAVANFPISGQPLPDSLIQALGRVKAACARVNAELNLLEADIADAIFTSAMEIAEGSHSAHFPVDVFQTGSGTSSNMNANEVIAHLASSRLGRPVHPNDHVNMGQSSNDVFPTAMAVAAGIAVHDRLLPALRHLGQIIRTRAEELDGITKTGRTHLMDAMPIRLGQELGGWASQVSHAAERIEGSLPRLAALPIGGTAVGTGINTHPEFGPRVAKLLARETGVFFRDTYNYFEGLSSQDASVEMSGQMKAAAVMLMKISNDLRWMNSGPLAGLGEIALPALQPGSSIMPGKVNPVIPEAVAMGCAQVIGNDTAITVGGQSGNFQLNVMLPMIARNLLESSELLANGARVLADKAIAGFTVNEENLREALDRNPILITALNRVIGYEQGAAIAKQAYAEARPVLEVALEQTDLTEEELRKLLDPARLTYGGLE